MIFVSLYLRHRLKDLGRQTRTAPARKTLGFNLTPFFDLFSHALKHLLRI